jgi:hypothetical protein
LKEWTTPDFRNTPSTTNLEEEEIVDAAGNDGNASMPEQFKRPNPWRKIMMMIRGKMFMLEYQWQCEYINVNTCGYVPKESVLYKNRVLEGYGLCQGANHNSY